MNPDYKLYHPKWHRRRIPIFWWLKKLAFTKFIIRELTSLAVCYTAILMLVQIWVLSQGEAFYERWLAWLSWLDCYDEPLLEVNICCYTENQQEHEALVNVEHK